MDRDNQGVAERVVGAVATVSGVDPLVLPPLYDAIDPDALDALVEGMTDGEVVFTYAECEITVTAAGVIDVEGSGPATRSAETVPTSN
ncbi:hypothetical protein B4589_001780 [Halolamina sp. CBA1230]|uniref:HalOD1 output domain-containing protein n=1 Tax=Halolamina sp. CBA1230 TaxID=1853690 RepID=UPI0009A1DF76|nr:HalOD1 output domain-containing protein [Halolamina sp. CBA1230]QKY19167.1 hypothetical protein B4589_001780 [Halolamina sp. CBA1230]